MFLLGVKPTMLNENVFNTQKTDYDVPNLLLGERMGLIDSVNRHFPKIWDLYKKLKFLDWDENEFDFTLCNAEFKSCSRSEYDMMIKTLAWQWEADSVVGRKVAPIVSAFVTSSELLVAWYRVSDNETLHSLTYSEIVRNSFDDPSVIFNEVLAISESFERLETLTEVFDTAETLACRYRLGEIENTQELYEAALAFVVALLGLERIQFMASFAVTFALADSGLFVPIGKAVQKICQDEFEIHVEIDRFVLEHEFSTKKGEIARENKLPYFKAILDEIVLSEINWVDYLFSDDRELVGVTPELLKDWVYWCAKDAYDILRIEPEFEVPNKNPLPFMDDWITNDHQPSPQEERPTAYMLGGVKDTIGDEIITFDI